MAINIAQLAAGMARAAKRQRQEYYSDSDDSIEGVSNRGHKLKKRAKYVHEGQLAPPSGPEVYRETINHAGYERDIVARRPVVYDDDGYEIDSADEIEEHRERLDAAMESYPYANIRIEELLQPLSRPADLPNHPTLSTPFKSKHLTELSEQARSMCQKEKRTLWKLKRLLTKLSGDQDWAPAGMFERPSDNLFFEDPYTEYREHLQSKEVSSARAAEGARALKELEAAKAILLNSFGTDEIPEDMDIETDVGKAVDRVLPNGDSAMIDASLSIAETEETLQKVTEGNNAPEAEEEEQVVAVINGEASKEGTEGVIELAPGGDVQTLQGSSGKSEGGASVANDEEALDEEGEPAPRRMRTRAQAQAASDENHFGTNRSTSPDSNSSYVHPYFLPPPSARPDRDLGLPMQEADEVRRLVQLYTQKQEEVCRGVEKIYDQLLAADRMRKTIWKWCKAEGHIGEMSDGEDWYDKEEWGLVEDLKKGQDEEEEDAATTAKKTRTRRQ